MNDLRFVIVPGQWPEQQDRATYAEVYRCWKEVWSKTFIELDKTDDHLKSDAFTRQDYVGAIFNKDVCIALCFYRWCDPTLETLKADSYFSNWAETHIKKLTSRGSSILVCSNFTIAPSARGLQLGFSMKDLLVGTSLRFFLESGADAMTGALRRDKHVNEACARWGGVELAREIPSGHGDATVDLMAFYQKEISMNPRRAESDLVDRLWMKRQVVSSYRVSIEKERIAA
ncbi:MAG: hypothetical protein EOP04_23645 [Proteobacteria bacterium]|nr:MAG: hypothetical protein EOP04_23645 [Pseudomonadota bacterium]